MDLDHPCGRAADRNLFQGRGICQSISFPGWKINELDKHPDTLAFWRKRLGDPKTDKEMLIAISPAYHAETIKVPVFMCYGQLDPRVDIEHGYLLQKALKRAGNSPLFFSPHEEGHGLSIEKDKLKIYPELEKFLKKNLD